MMRPGRRWKAEQKGELLSVDGRAHQGNGGEQHQSRARTFRGARPTPVTRNAKTASSANWMARIPVTSMPGIVVCRVCVLMAEPARAPPWNLQGSLRGFRLFVPVSAANSHQRKFLRQEKHDPG